MRRIILLLIALISLVSLAAAACGSEDESGEAMPDTAAVSPTEAPATETKQTETTAPATVATKDQQPTPAESPSTAKVEEQAEVEERTGGVLRRLWSDPPTLDPHLSGDTTSAGVVVEIYSGLVALNTDLPAGPRHRRPVGDQRGRKDLHLLHQGEREVPGRQADNRE